MPHPHFPTRPSLECTCENPFIPGYPHNTASHTCIHTLPLATYRTPRTGSIPFYTPRRGVVPGHPALGAIIPSRSGRPPALRPLHRARLHTSSITVACPTGRPRPSPVPEHRSPLAVPPSRALRNFIATVQGIFMHRIYLRFLGKPFHVASVAVALYLRNDRIILPQAAHGLPAMTICYIFTLQNQFSACLHRRQCASSYPTHSVTSECSAHYRIRKARRRA